MKWFVMGYLDIKRPSQNFKYPILYGLGARFRKFIKVLLKIKHDVGSKIGTVSAQSCIDNGCDEYHGRPPGQLMLFISHQMNKKLLAELESDAKKVAEWRTTLEWIRYKTNDEFVEYLESFGLEALGEIKAIDKLSEAELQEYLDLHNKIHKGDLPMPKEKSLAQGIELLQGLDLTKADGVTVNTFTYDDGSTSIEVGVSYPAPVPKDADTAER